jgi:hypothetical protein
LPFILEGKSGEPQLPSMKSIIPENLRSVYAEVVAKVVERGGACKAKTIRKA